MVWLGNEELVDLYEKRLGEAGYTSLKLARTNNRGDGLLSAIQRDYFRIINYKELLFNDFGDRVAQLLHIELHPFLENRSRNIQQQMLVVNTHLLFPHNYSYSTIRLHQLRGRAGRQGDPGSTRFMVSLQDEMFKKFNFDTEWAVKLISRITNDEDMPIEGNTIVKQLLSLQINAEKYYFGIRKSLVEFDEVLEVQRKHVYDLRQSILTGDSQRSGELIFQYMQAVVDENVFANVDSHKHPREWSLVNLLDEYVEIGGNILAEQFAKVNEEDLLSALVQIHGLNSINVDSFFLQNLPTPPNTFRGIHKKNLSLIRWLTICSDDTTKKGNYSGTVNLLRKYLGDFLIASYLHVVQDSGYDDAYVKDIEREVIVKTLDSFWKDHLVNMNRLSSAVNVRSFGHRNPLEEYKIDGCRFFISMLSATRRLTVKSLMYYWSSSMESEDLLEP